MVVAGGTKRDGAILDTTEVAYIYCKPTTNECDEPFWGPVKELKLPVPLTHVAMVGLNNKLFLTGNKMKNLLGPLRMCHCNRDVGSGTELLYRL